MKKILLLILAFTLVIFNSCEKDNGQDTTKSPFSLTLDNTTEEFATVTCSPLDLEMKYIIGYMDKASFDNIENETKLVEYLVAYFSEFAAAFGMSIGELIGENLEQGEVTKDYPIVSTTEDYIVYVMGVNLDGDTLTSTTEIVSIEVNAIN